MSEDSPAIPQPVAIYLLWAMGSISWLLKPVQQAMHSMYCSSSQHIKYVINSSRRLGKSYLMCAIAIQYAIQNPDSQIRFAAPTQKALKKIIHPIFKKIISTCPRSLRPVWRSQDGLYEFPNGSQIHLAGANNGHDEDLRGTEAHLCLVDEAGFIDDLTYLVDDILVPQLLTTNGRIIIASTPARSPAHAFNEYALEAKHAGNYAHFTIFEAGYSEEKIEQFCKEAGGEKSTTWRREYLADLTVVDENMALVPEASDLKPGIVKCDPEHYDRYHKYVAMDLGVRDLNVTIFGYYDFIRAKLVIEREHVMSGPKMTTPKLHGDISKIEKELWNGAEPYKRVADNNNPLLLLDLGSIHNMFFHSTSKDNLHAMVNNLRVWVANGRIEIDESCRFLIDSLKFGIWNEARTEFARSKTLGHFDAVAALMYLVRNIDEQTNPIPVKIGFNQFIDHEMESNFDSLKALAGRR